MRTVSALAAMLSLILATSVGAQPTKPVNLNPAPLTNSPQANGPIAIRGGACAGGEIYDDGGAENGYSGNPATISLFEGVMQFTPSSYPNGYETVCIGLVSLGGPTLDFEIEVRDDDGAGGTPGTLLGTVPVSVTDLPGGLPCAFYTIDISSMGLNIASGSVFIGARWNPMNFPSRFVCADESPGTPLQTGFINFNNPDTWQATQTVFPSYRALLVRAIEGLGTPQLTLGNVTELDTCAREPSNQNGIIEPGELINFSIPIEASGGGFTNVIGMLTSGTPGVTVLSGMGTYGTIPDGGSATANFSIQLDEMVACDSVLDLNLAVTSTEDNFAFPITRNVGLSAAFTYNGLPAPIPDNNPAGISVTADVAGVPGPITNVEVQVNVAHTWVGDVTLELTSPEGTTVTLLDRPGVPATTFGCNNEDINVRFADGQPDPESVCGAADTPWPVTDASPVPGQAMADFSGENANGAWTLRAIDSAGGDTGTIIDWELFIAPAAGGTCNICPAGIELPEPVSVPTLGVFALGGLIALLGGLGLWMRRRHV